MLPHTKVLLAESRLSGEASVKGLLELQDMIVLEYENGIEAVKRSFSENPDVIILESNIPLLDAFLSTRILKNDPYLAKTPIIIIGAADEPVDRSWAMASGADYYVESPVDAEALEDAFRSIFKKKVVKSERLRSASITPLLNDTDIVSMAASIIDKSHFKAYIINEISRIDPNETDIYDFFKAVMAWLSSLYDFSVGSVLLNAHGESEILFYRSQPLDTERLRTIKRAMIESPWAEATFAASTQTVAVETVINAAQMKVSFTEECDLHIHGPGPGRGLLLALDNIGYPVMREEEKETLDAILDAACAALKKKFDFDAALRLGLLDTVRDDPSSPVFMRKLSAEMALAKENGAPLTIFTIEVKGGGAMLEAAGERERGALFASLEDSLMHSITRSSTIARTGEARFAFIMPNATRERSSSFIGGLSSVIASSFEKILPEGEKSLHLVNGMVQYTAKLDFEPEDLLKAAYPVDDEDSASPEVYDLEDIEIITDLEEITGPED